MIQILIDITIFSFSIILVYFLPGWLLTSLLERKKKFFYPLEKLVIALGLGHIFITFLMILMAKADLELSRGNLALALVIFLCGGFLLKKTFWRSDRYDLKSENSTRSENFSKLQIIFISLLIFLTFFIKTSYLSKAIYPSATDLAHHSFWVEKIIQTKKLPSYLKTDIINENGNFIFGQPQLMADFIIGEHLSLSAAMILSQKSVLSSHLTLLIFLLHIFGVLSAVILSYRLFYFFKWGHNAAILTLLLFGPLYAISSAQAKFVSGGVVGNILGNLLIPLCLYFLYRAVQEKEALFFYVGCIFLFSIFYTHHLSALIISAVISATLAMLFGAGALSKKREIFRQQARYIVSLIVNKKSFVFFLLLFIFFFLIYTPEYVTTNAAKNIVGTPTKSTKQGFAFNQISDMTGETRLILGLASCLLFMHLAKKNPLASFLATAWIAVIFLLSWKPAWFHINIPSARIVNYLALPATLGASAFIAWFFKNSSEKKPETLPLPSSIIFSFFFAITAITLADGLYDNASNFKQNPILNAPETHLAGKILSQKIGTQDILIKDHNYVSSDAWLKIYFMRDYNFPLTRSYFFRYEENKDKEQCTLSMISSPESELAEKCFADLGVNYILVNSAYDSRQFDSSGDFDKIFNSGTISVYYYRSKNDL